MSQSGASRSNRVLHTPITLKLYGNVIPVVKSHKYLGVYFDNHLTWKPHIDYLTNTLVNKVNILKAISGREWGADRTSMLMLYKHMIRPKIEYGCILYASASETNLKRLDSIQNQCIKIATGAFKSSRTKDVEVEANIPSLRLHYHLVILRTVAPIVASPSHPVRMLVDDFSRYIHLSHPPFSTRAHLLARKYNVPFDWIEPVPHINTEQWATKANIIHLNSDLSKADCTVALLQDALSIINNYPDHEPYYTDGSKMESRTGAGIHSASLSRGFRLPNDYSVFDAELFAIFAAIEHILQEEKSAILFSDSRSSLEAIKNCSHKHPLVLKICKLILTSPISIYLAWIPSHIGIPGNERADDWAKRSLNYRDMDITPSPISYSTLMRMTKSKIQLYWQNEWSRRGYLTYKQDIGPTLTAARPRRCEEVALCRLRMGKTMLTHITPWMCGTFPDNCEHCGDRLTIKHILVDCVHFIRQRRDIAQHFITAQTPNLSIYSLLKDDKVVIDLLIKYLWATGLISKL